MINPDNINIDLPRIDGDKDRRILRLDMMKWLKENNVKYSKINYPGNYGDWPDAFNLRKVDAIYFKLRFNL